MPHSPYVDFNEYSQNITSIDSNTSKHQPDSCQVLEFPIPSRDCFYGLIGELALESTEKTEADPFAVYMTLLAFIASHSKTWYDHGGGIRHPISRFYHSFVGKSSKARKGTSALLTYQLYDIINPMLIDQGYPALNMPVERITTGQGLVYALRDESEKLDDEGNPEDEGIEDKRLFVLEEEMGALFREFKKENSPSAVMRTLFDRGSYGAMNRGVRYSATHTYFNYLGHITLNELLKYVHTDELTNGLANRFAWFCIQRSKIVSSPVSFSSERVTEVAKQLVEIIKFSHHNGTIKLGDDARRIWDGGIYHQLTKDGHGKVGAITDRAETHVLKWAGLLALIDKEVEVKVHHLRAALAKWDFNVASVQYVFEAKNDEKQEKIIDYLKANGRTSQTELSNKVFGRNLKSHDLQQSLKQLEASKQITRLVPDEGRKGRKTTYWELTATN